MLNTFLLVTIVNTVTTVSRVPAPSPAETALRQGLWDRRAVAGFLCPDRSVPSDAGRGG